MPIRWISVISGMVLFVLFPLAAPAHVGSPDFYYDGHAGPYHVLVTVRPPQVIPGIAEIQIRSLSGQLSRVDVIPMRLVGDGAKLAPTPDAAERSSADPQLFIGKLWIMSRGSWKVQINADGTQGKGELAVPIAAVSASSMRMQKSLGALLAVLGLILVVGLVGIVRAATSDAVVEPGATPSPSLRRRAFIITSGASVFIVAALVFGDFWWTADASNTEKLSYKLPHLQLSLRAGNVLQLKLQNPNDVEWRQFPSELADPDKVRLDDLMPDHGHIMHLFLVRTPDMASFWHLHPQAVSGPDFAQALPSLPAGHYRIFADIVHQTGFPETQVGEIDLPAISAAPANGMARMNAAPVQGDDAGGAELIAGEKVSQLSDGYRMVWERDSTPLKANQAIWFRFRIEDRNGNPATGMENYMGMAGHAAFIRNDGQVFAHVHPAGSISMAAAELAQGDGGDAANSPDKMAGMNHAPASAEVTFPYGFPQPGDYHIFVQIKRAGKIETGAFTARVEN
ncbi:MAG TPA: hypothetical protein VI636_25425 [Candidatus Angelobacter sp.]